MNPYSFLSTLFILLSLSSHGVTHPLSRAVARRPIPTISLLSPWISLSSPPIHTLCQTPSTPSLSPPSISRYCCFTCNQKSPTRPSLSPPSRYFTCNQTAQNARFNPSAPSPPHWLSLPSAPPPSHRASRSFSAIATPTGQLPPIASGPRALKNFHKDIRNTLGLISNIPMKMAFIHPRCYNVDLDFFTYHGLWKRHNMPAKPEVHRVKFESMLKPLVIDTTSLDELMRYWQDLYKYNDLEASKQFWRHEYSKHGQHTGLTFFETAQIMLDIRAKLSKEFGLKAGKDYQAQEAFHILHQEFGCNVSLHCVRYCQVNYIMRVELLMDRRFKIVNFSGTASYSGSIKEDDDIVRLPNIPMPMMQHRGMPAYAHLFT